MAAMRVLFAADGIMLGQFTDVRARNERFSPAPAKSQRARNVHS